MYVRRILISLKRRLYIYVGIVLIIALILGYFIDFSGFNIRPISITAVFIMLYPMLTGIEVEKIKYAGKNYKLIITTIIFAYFIASLTAFIVSRTILISYPDLALAIILVGAIPCSNMLIGWSGIADASVEDALVIAITGLLLIPFISPVLIKISGSAIMAIDASKVFLFLGLYIIIPLILGFYTRHIIIKKKGRKYFISIKKYLPGVSATGILLIIFFTVAKVSRIVIMNPMIFILVFAGLFTYYLVQTGLSLTVAKIFRFRYEEGIILIIGATASSQAISLSLAATIFSALTVFALSLKPILQVIYIMFLIYAVGPWLKKFLG